MGMKLHVDLEEVFHDARAHEIAPFIGRHLIDQVILDVIENGHGDVTEPRPGKIRVFSEGPTEVPEGEAPEDGFGAVSLAGVLDEAAELEGGELAGGIDAILGDGGEIVGSRQVIRIGNELFHSGHKSSHVTVPLTTRHKKGGSG